MFRSLVWKEWHEQRWRLWFGVFLLGLFTLIGLRTRIMPDDQIFIFSIIVGGVGFPLMVAMGLVAQERSEGTIARLMALPVPPWQVVAAKGVVGAAVCVAPVVVSGILAAVVAGDRELDWRDLFGIYGIALGVSLSMFTWMTAATVRQPSEARAGIVGVGLIVAWFLLTAVASGVRAELAPESHVEQWTLSFGPFGFIALRDADIPAAAVVGIQLASLAALWWWAAKRIGKPGKVVA